MDVNRARILILGDFAIKGSAMMGSASLGTHIFMTLADIAPYLGADFGFGFAKLQDDGLFNGTTLGGFALGFSGGVEFLRTSSVNVELGSRVGLLLRSTELGTPLNFSVRLGVYF